MRNIPSRPYGSTRLEVLFVTGMIAILIALLLPAVQNPISDSVSGSYAANRIPSKSMAKGKVNAIRTARM